jgi:hypothetical protein
LYRAKKGASFCFVMLWMKQGVGGFIVAGETLQQHLVLVVHKQLAAIVVVADDPAVLQACNIRKCADVECLKSHAVFRAAGQTCKLQRISCDGPGAPPDGVRGR